MPLRVDQVPNCCTAKVINAFGGSGTAMYGRDASITKVKLAKELKEKMESVARDGNGIAVIFLTSEQKDAIEVVQSLGWKLVSTSKKKRHSETVLHLFTWECCDEAGEVPVVDNPFAVDEKAALQSVLRETAPVAKQTASAYRVRLPRNRWIGIREEDLDVFGQKMRESTHQKVAILTQTDLDADDLARRCQTRIETAKPAVNWRWNRAGNPSDIRYFMIIA